MGSCLFRRNEPGAGTAADYSASGGACIGSALVELFYQSRKGHLLAASITYVEMFKTAQQITATTYEPLLLYSEAALFYLLFCSVLSALQNVLEQRFDRYSAR